MKARNKTYLMTIAFLAISSLFSNTTVLAESTAKPQYHLKQSETARFDGALQSFALDLEKGLDLKPENVELFSKVAKQLGKLATQDPKELQKFVRAFSQSGSKADRKWARRWAETNGFLKAGDPESVAIWGAVAVIAIAFLVGSGCDGGGGCGSTCPTAGPCPADGSSGGSTGDTD